jgi:hypothetical protein
LLRCDTQETKKVLVVWIGVGFSLILAACSIQPKIPSLSDDRVADLVAREAARIIMVSEDSEHLSSYRFFLAEFPQKDILGLSVGDKRIYIPLQSCQKRLDESQSSLVT